jgi:hypothetical protein
MKSTGENRQLGEKSVPVPLCPQQISQGRDLGPNPRPPGNRINSDNNNGNGHPYLISVHDRHVTTEEWRCRKQIVRQ